MTEAFRSPAAKGVLVSVVVPAYCEEDNARPFYDALIAAVGDKNFDLELIFVDDGSTDNTYEFLCAIADTDARVRVLRLSKNFGSLAAITAGMHRARGDAVAIMSIDLQDPPELIAQFVEKWRDGYRVVWGVRKGRDDPFVKRILANGFHSLFRKITFANLPREGMDTGLFDRSVVDVFNQIEDHGIVPAYAIFSLGFESVSISYRRRRRQMGFNGWPFWKRIRNALDLITTYSYAPIRLISLLGLLGSTAAVVLGIKVLFDYLVLGLGDPGWPSLAVLILFVGSVQMLMLGIIAEYVWRTSRQVRGYPRYIVVDQHRLDKCGRQTNPARERIESASVD